jgi:hypothetical protein
MKIIVNRRRAVIRNWPPLSVTDLMTFCNVGDLVMKSSKCRA